MQLSVGDRVRSLSNDFPGLEEGETGTVIRLRENCTPLIRWDEYNESRHQYDGEVELGHGWCIYGLNQIELIPPEDLGEINNIGQIDALMELFSS